jgi:hypothetical protein
MRLAIHLGLKVKCLWQVFDSWLTGLKPETFVQILPLLRRTFSTFQPAERRMMGEKVTGTSGRTSRVVERLDEARGDAVLPLLEKLLGL